MKTENELIAEFMGAERREGPRAFNPDQTLVQWIIKGNPYNQHRDDIKHWYQPVELKYHESWDWLMPVLEKIAKLHSEKFHYDPVEMAKGVFPEDNDYMDVICLPVSTPIFQVYKAVVEFIKFYNSQNS